jgi:hypothetical protein
MPFPFVATAFPGHEAVNGMALSLADEIINSMGATGAVQSHKLCVLYDRANGHIQHEHRVLTLVGGREPSEAEMEEDAFRLAGDWYGDSGDLAALHTAPDVMQPGQRYRVDVDRKALIALN